MFNFADFIRHFFLYSNLIKKDEWIKVFESMAVHTRRLLPSKVLLALRPHEEPKSHAYRLANYRPITYGSMNKAFDSLFRLTNGVNYSLSIADELRTYIDKRIFMGKTFESFMADVVLKRTIEDPNGFLLWYPVSPDFSDTSIKVQVKPLLIYSSQLHYCNEEVFSFLSDEVSIVEHKGEEVLAGQVYWIFTNNQFFKYSQVGKSEDKEFKLTLIYNHNQGRIPAIVLGGDMNADCYYDSFFSPYVAFGDEAIATFSDWQIVKTSMAHPIIEEFAVECEFKADRRRVKTKTNAVEKFHGDDDMDDDNSGVAGDLKPLPKTPFSVILRKVPSGTDMDGVLDPNIPSRRYIAPPTEAIESLKQSWIDLKNEAEDALHLNLGKANQSGVAKELDKESHYSMVTKIFNNYFDNQMQPSLEFIYGYIVIDPNKRKDVIINKSATFKVKTEADLIDEVGDLTAKKVPQLFIASATRQLAKKYYSGDPIEGKIFNVASRYDTLYTYTIEQKDSMLGSGVITKDNYIRSVNMYGLMLQVCDEMGEETFLKADNKKIIEAFEVLLIPYLPEPVLDPFENQGSGTDDSYDDGGAGPLNPDSGGAA